MIAHIQPRPLPAALDSEMGVLSSVLLDPKCLESLKGKIKASHFHTPAHSTIWNCFLEMSAKGTPIDLVTVTQALADLNLLDQIGGPAVLANLQTFLPTATNVDFYANTIIGKWRSRQCVILADGLKNDAYENQANGDFGFLENAITGFEKIKIAGESTEEPLPSFSDLSPFLDGNLEQEIPSIAPVWEGRSLFYAGRLNELHGEPGVGKTNIIMAACIAEMEQGGSVLYIDPEDTPRGFVARMLMLGASLDAIREQVFYLHNPTPDEIRTAQKWSSVKRPEIVVLDGLAESMAAVGAREDSAGDALIFLRENLRPFADSGCAVVIADHVTKNSDSRGIFARGSGAKAGRYDGVSYEIVPAVSYSPQKAGLVKLKISKDRNGGAGPRGMTVAELHFTPGADGRTIVNFREPAEKQDGIFRPTFIMDKIMNHLKVHKEATCSELRGVGGKTQSINKAIKCLMDEGKIDSRKEGNKVIYFLEQEAASS